MEKSVRVCSLEGCGKKHFGRGLCKQHYRQQPDQKAKTKETAARWHAENKERYAEVRKTPEYRAVDNARRAIRREENREAYNAYRRARNAANPDKAKVIASRWAKANPDKCNVKTQRRRALHRDAEGSFTYAEWQAVLEKFGHKCAFCSSENRLTIDHIIPLSKGGTNFISNIQPLCLSCNSRKGAKVG